jgi:hypothetical protein
VRSIIFVAVTTNPQKIQIHQRLTIRGEVAFVAHFAPCPGKLLTTWIYVKCATAVQENTLFCGNHYNLVGHLMAFCRGEGVG